MKQPHPNSVLAEFLLSVGTTSERDVMRYMRTFYMCRLFEHDEEPPFALSPPRERITDVVDTLRHWVYNGIVGVDGTDHDVVFVVLDREHLREVVVTLEQREPNRVRKQALN